MNGKQTTAFSISPAVIGWRKASSDHKPVAPGLEFSKTRARWQPLSDAYRGRVPRAGTRIAGDGIPLLRPGRTGLFNLATFLRVKPSLELARLSAGATPPPVPAHLAPPTPRFSERLAAACRWAIPYEDIGKLAPGSAQVAKGEVGRDALAQGIQRQFENLRRLETDLPASGLSEDEVEAARTRLQEAQADCMRAAVAVAVPELFCSLDGQGVNQQAVKELDAERQLAPFLKLKASLEGQNLPDCSLDRMLAVLAHDLPKGKSALKAGSLDQQNHWIGELAALANRLAEAPTENPSSLAHLGHRGYCVHAARRQLSQALELAMQPGRDASLAPSGTLPCLEQTARREALMKDLRASMAQLRKLEADFPGLKVLLDQPRQQCAQAALALALPGLAPDIAALHSSDLPEPPGSPAQALRDMVRQLVALDDRIASTGQTDCGIDALVTALSNHARIREFAGMSDQPTRDKAVSGLAALAGTMLEAVGEGRDGAALHGLLGLSGELDSAIRSLRVDATQKFMIRQGVRDEKGARATPTQEVLAQTLKHAEALVSSELDVAKARLRLQRALQMAGVPPILGGLAGVKFDSSLVRGLRKALGDDARKVGLVIAALMAVERAATGSAEARRMLKNVQSELAYRHEQLTEVSGKPARKVRDEIRFLEQRKAGLQTEAEVADTQDAKEYRLDRKLIAARDELVVLRSEVRSLQGSDSGTKVHPRLQARIGKLERIFEKLPTRVHDEKGDMPDASSMQLSSPGHFSATRSEELSASDLLITEHAKLKQLQRDAILAKEPLKQASEARSALVARQQDWVHKLEQIQKQRADLERGGLSEGELEKLGLSGDEASVVLETVSGLARQGLASADEAGAAMATVNAVMKALTRELGSRDAQAAASVFTGIQDTRDEDKALQLGDLLLRNLVGDPALRMIDARIPARSKAMADKVKAALAPMLPAFTTGNVLRPQLGDVEKRLVACVDELNQLPTARDSARRTLVTFNSALGARVDVDHPSGLRSCLKMREALDLYNDLVKKGGTADSIKKDETLKGLLNDLKGFDELSLKKGLISRREFKFEQFRQCAGRASFVDAINAVITLRAGEARILEKVETQVRNMETRLQQRRSAMGEPAAQAVRGAVRAAILVNLGSTPLRAFQPGEQAVKIKATLLEWGVPVDTLQPEIDSLLSESFGPDELNLWREDTQLSPEYLAKADEAHRARVEELEAHDPTAAVSAQTRLALLDSVANLKMSTRVRLTTGSRIEVQSGAIPLDPLGVSGINAKVAKGDLQALEIGVSTEGYEMVFRKGMDLKGGLDFSTKVRGWDALGIKVGATASLDLAEYRAAGLALRFPYTNDGLNTMKSVLDKLLTARDITATDIQSAQEVIPLLERKHGAKVSATAGATYTFKPGETEGHASASGGLSASAGLGVQVTRFNAENANVKVRKTQSEVTLELSASASTGLGLVTTKSHGARTDLLSASATATYVKTTKTKDSRLKTDNSVHDAERLEQMYALPGKDKGMAAFELVGGPEFALLMKTLTESRNAEDRTMAESIKALAAQAGPNDLLSVASTLDERVRSEVNGLLADAHAWRSGRRGTGSPQASALEAERLEKQAQARMEDPRSYILARISLIPTRESTATRTLANLVLVKRNTYVEEKGEYVALEVKPDRATARRVHDTLAKAAIATTTGAPA